METKFTPGPWLVSEHVTVTSDGWQNMPTKRFICTIRGFHRTKEAISEATANARLIAAAPTMASYIKSRADAGDEEAKKIWQEATNAAA